MDLMEELKQYMEANNFERFQPRELYEPLDYILSLGGKRIRPLLTLMACQLYSSNIENALPAAYAIEVFHNFSLLHDDIMDESPIRRGKATVHKKYDTNTAILSGDVMLVYAYEYLSRVSNEYLPLVLKTFNEIAIGVCEGQQMDMNFESQEEVAQQDYLRMIELKTSVLLYGAMKIGAIVGGASIEEAELIGAFGRNTGIAFQLQDDYLDSFGKEAKVGKRIGGDIIQNKKTYLVIKAMQKSSKQQFDYLKLLLNKTVAKAEEKGKIEEVKSIFEQLNIPEEMDKIIGHYRDKAIENLHATQLSSKQKAPLLKLLEKLMHREH
jgi:geranylgeranyl diphosphate synthase type II